MMGVAHGGGKGRAVAAKSAHSAALLDRLWNINLQHYRPEEEAPSLSLYNFLDTRNQLK